MRNRIGRNISILNIRGTAIIMALVTMTILLILGLAVATLSMGTLQASTADATTNDSYYAADAGISNALDQLKLEVARYYKGMTDAQGTVYTGLYSNFASGIAANAQTNFSEPSISGGSTSTTFSVAGHDAQTNVYEFLATTTSTMADGTQYIGEGRLNVKRVDVSAKDWFIDGAAVIAGGTLKLGATCGMGVSGSNVIVADFTHSRTGWVPLSVSNGTLNINPTIGDSINDVLTYPSYSNPVITNPKLFISVNDTVVNWANVPTSPVSIDTAPNTSFSISSTSVPVGTIRGRANVTVSNCSAINSDIYCDGNFSATSCTLNGDIYVRGNIVINNGVFNGDIYCDGSVTLYSGSLKGTVICNGSITIHNASSVGNLFATGQISMASNSISAGIVYSKTRVSLGDGSATAIVFSGGDIVFTGSGTVSGMLIAKNDIYFSTDKRWYNISYNASSVNAILNNHEFFRSGQGAAELSNDVIMGQSITAKGRVN